MDGWAVASRPLKCWYPSSPCGIRRGGSRSERLCSADALALEQRPSACITLPFPVVNRMRLLAGMGR